MAPRANLVRTSTFDHVPGGVGTLNPPTAVFRSDHNAYFVEYGKNGGYLYIDWRVPGGLDGEIVTVRLLNANSSEVRSSQVQLFRSLVESERALAARPLLAPPPPSELEFTLAKGIAKVKFHICAAAEDVEGKAFCLEFQHWDAQRERRKGAACLTQPLRCQSRNRDGKQPRSKEFEDLMQRTKVAKESLMHLPEEVVRTVMDSLTSNVEHFEQIVKTANARAEKAATAAAGSAGEGAATATSASAITGIVAAGAESSARPPCASAESVGGDSYHCGSSHHSAASGSTSHAEGSGTPLHSSEGSGTPLHSPANPTASDNDETHESELDETLKELFPQLTELYGLDEDEEERSQISRGFRAVPAPSPLEKAEALSELIAALNVALIAKLEIGSAVGIGATETDTENLIATGTKTEIEIVTAATGRATAA